MIVKFKNPHPGIGGPVKALPEVIRDYVNKISGLDGPLNSCVGRIAVLAPEGYWVSVDMEDKCIRLRSSEGEEGLEHTWKLIEFEEV